MANANMQAVRMSCIEFVESVDRVLLDKARRGEPHNHNEFDKAVVRSMERLASIPAIHKLRGRVREASDLECIAAMTVLADFAADADGLAIVRTLEHAALESKQPQVAQRLRELRAEMLKHTDEARRN